jgi:hypothetical protein
MLETHWDISAEVSTSDFGFPISTTISTTTVSFLNDPRPEYQTAKQKQDPTPRPTMRAVCLCPFDQPSTYASS